jgi:hypothetical protein
VKTPRRTHLRPVATAGPPEWLQRAVTKPARPFLRAAWTARSPGADPAGAARVASCLAYLTARDVALLATGATGLVGQADAARAAGTPLAPGSLMGCLITEATALLTGRTAPAHIPVPGPRHATHLSAPVSDAAPLPDAISDPGGEDQLDADGGGAWTWKSAPGSSAEGSMWPGKADGPSWPPPGHAAPLSKK